MPLILCVVSPKLWKQILWWWVWYCMILELFKHGIVIYIIQIMESQIKIVSTWLLIYWQVYELIASLFHRVPVGWEGNLSPVLTNSYGASSLIPFILSAFSVHLNLFISWWLGTNRGFPLKYIPIHKYLLVFGPK